MGDLIKCIKVSLQFNLELPDTHSLEKETLHNLCSAFYFWYDTFVGNEHTLHANIYFPANNIIYQADFNNIIKTYAVFHGVYILNSEIIEIPYSDQICLDKEK